MAGQESIIIVLAVDSKAGMAALKQFGDQAVKTNAQMGGVTGTTGKFGDVLKKVSGSVLGFTSVTALASGAILTLIDKLMSAGNQFSAAEISAAKFTNEIRNAKQGIQEYVDYLNSQSELEKLMTQLTMGRGFSADQKSIGIAIDNNKTIIDGAYQTIAKYNKELANLSFNAAFLLGKSGRQLVQEFPDFTDMPDDLINKLGSSDKKLLQRAKADALVVQSEYTRISKLHTENKRLTIQLQINTNEEMKRLQMQNAAEYEKYVNDIISLAKKYSAGLKSVIDIDPGFSLFDDKNEEFIKARSFLEKLGSGQYKFKIPPVQLNIEIPPEEAKQEATEFATMFARELNAYFKKGEVTDFTLINAEQAYLDAQKVAEQLLTENENIAQMIAQTVSPAFMDMFDAIIEKEDALKAFFSAIGNSIKQLVKQLIAAALQAAVLSFLGGGVAKGGLSFAGQFKKVLGFASGGLVTGPVSALIGEGHGTSRSNPEVVSPLDRLKSFFNNMMTENMAFSAGSRMGTAGSVVGMPREVILRGQGRELVGVIALENASQGRTG